MAARSRRRVLLAVATAAVVLAAAGLVTVAMNQPRRSASPSARGGAAPRFSFVTPQVSLTADDVWIDVGGQRFTSEGTTVELNSDPGDATYQTLELVWHEHDVEMRVNIYFAADASEWWSTELRTYNGQANGDWVTFAGDRFRTPLGSAATTTVDETATENGVTSHLHLGGMRLQAFLGLGPGGVTVPTHATVPAPAVGRLQVPPRAADLPATGRAWVPDDSLALAVAQEALTAACMSAKGWQYPTRSVGAWVAEAGAWQPDEVLGIGGVDGARAYGYHDAGAKGSDPLAAYRTGLSPVDQTRFDADLTGPSADPVDVTAPSGSILATRLDGGCLRQMVARFGEAYDRQDALRLRADAVWENARQAAAADPTVLAALASWEHCVDAAVGEMATTPNELARRYSFVAGAATDHEKLVAAADAQCQHDERLWTVYSSAIADAERALMGADVSAYDELTRLRMQMVATAREVLAERNITVPSIG